MHLENRHQIDKMTFFQGFFLDFYPSTKAKKPTVPRVDEIPYFLTWPLTFLLNKTGILATRVVFASSLFGVAFLILLASNQNQTQQALLCFLLISRILLDYTDGQLARYSGKTSNLGALYDLISDFAFTLLLFLVVSYLLIFAHSLPIWKASLLAVGAFLANVISATTASYLARLSATPNKPQAVTRKEFLSQFTSDHPKDKAYTRKVELLNRLFYFSWHRVSHIVIFGLIRGKHVSYPKIAAHSTTFFANSMHLFLLSFFIFFGVSLVTFCLVEISLFAVHLFILMIFQLLPAK